MFRPQNNQTGFGLIHDFVDAGRTRLHLRQVASLLLLILQNLPCGF